LQRNNATRHENRSTEQTTSKNYPNDAFAPCKLTKLLSEDSILDSKESIKEFFQNGKEKGKQPNDSIKISNKAADTLGFRQFFCIFAALIKHVTTKTEKETR
jgi:hypothetical protein